MIAFKLWSVRRYVVSRFVCSRIGHYRPQLPYGCLSSHCERCWKRMEEL
jgi:hypothetical protein